MTQKPRHDWNNNKLIKSQVAEHLRKGRSAVDIAIWMEKPLSVVQAQIALIHQEEADAKAKK